MKALNFEKKNGESPNLHSFVDKTTELLQNGLWQIVFRKPPRTNLENRTLHGWIRLISEETGNDQSTLYQYYCEKFNPLGCSYFKDGNFCSGGTSKLNTKEFAQFLTEIQADVAQELGIILPTTFDKEFNDYYK